MINCCINLRGKCSFFGQICIKIASFTPDLGDWDRSGSEQEYQQAIELNPGYATAHQYYGDALSWMGGRPEEGVAEEKRALQLDPLSLVINFNLGRALYFARQYDQEIVQDQKTLELDPNYFLAHRDLGRAYIQESKYEEGTAEFEKVLMISPGDAIALSDLGHAYAVAGRRAEAQKVLAQLNELSKQKYVPAYGRAVIYAGLLEKDKGIEWLEKAFEERDSQMIRSKVEPMFDPLRSDSRFQDLLRRMNLQP